ncbi:MAG: radical SAM protein [Spirochaetota bacterium]|nr:radical SAM protein [Spirochaetota bacterium]
MILSKSKRYARNLLVSSSISLIGRLGHKGLKGALNLLKGLMPNDRVKRGLEAMKEYVDRGHPFVDWLLSFNNFDPKVRDKIYTNLFANGFIGVKSQREYRDSLNVGLLTMVISVTQRCNLKCTGCWASVYEKEKDLDYDVLCKIIEESNEMSTYYFSITGGEPFVRKDLFDLFEKYNDSYFQVYTNGTMITEKVADRLLKAGNVLTLLSIDGYTKEINDKRRGEGVHEKLIKAMDILRERKLFFGVSITVTSQNVEEIMNVEFWDFLLSKGIKIGWIFQYMPVGSNPDISLMISAEQRDALRRFVYKIRNSRPIFVGDFWNDGYMVEGCMAGGNTYIHINNKGDVEPCVFCHFSTDNIYEKSLKDCVTSPFFNAIRGEIPYDGNILSPCMLIDRPEVFRKHFADFNPKPTHEGAESLVTNLASELDEKSRQLKKVNEPAWLDEDYIDFYTFDPRYFKAM